MASLQWRRSDMANETKRGQGNQGMGGGQGSGSDQSERPAYPEKERPGFDVDPNKEIPTRKDAGQGGSQRDQGGGFQQPGQGGGFEQPGQDRFRKEGDAGRSDRSGQSPAKK